MLAQAADDHYQAVSLGGKTQTKTVVADTESEPMAVGDLAKNINDYL